MSQLPKPVLKYDHERNSWSLGQKYDWGWLSFEWDGTVIHTWIKTGGVNKRIGSGGDAIDLNAATRLVPDLRKDIEFMRFRFGKLQQYQDLWLKQ